MPKLLKKWLKGIGSSFLLILLVFLKVAVAQTTDPKESASLSYGTVQGQIGSEESLNKNALEPIVSGTTMYTFDQSKSGQVQMVCPSSKKFVEVLIQPSGTGDITYTVISQDINLDGTPEYTVSFNTPISGVCADGFISCNPGTWTNCTYYKWQADNTGKISVVEGSLSNLSSCYCINSSCGSNLVWNNLATVLEDLGGGVVAALNQVLPQSAVSKSQLNYQISGTSIIFFGQDSANCATQTAGAGPSNPQTYFENPSALSGAGVDLAAIELAKSDSIYSTVMNSPATTGIVAEKRPCRIVRGGSVNRQTTSVSGSGSYSGLCTDHFVFFKGRLLTDADGNKHVKLLVVDTDPGGNNLHWNCGGANTTDLPLFENWHTLRDVDIPDTMEVTNVYFCLSITSGPGCSGVGGGSVCTQNANQSAQSTVVCDASGAQSVSFNYNYSIEGTTEDFVNQIYNSCEKIESDPNCTLWDEIVDGVQTVSNGAATGLTPEPVCKTIAGVTKSQTICDWWVKERVYKCNAGPAQFDFSDAKQRMGVLKSTTQDLGTEIYYQDMRKTEGGGWITEARTIQLPERALYESCERACKVRRLKQNTQVGQPGVATDYQTNNTTYEIVYNTCTIDSDNQYHCPTSPGDEILVDCSCINDFNEAAIAVQFLRLAGQDLICSDNVPKPIQFQ